MAFTVSNHPDSGLTMTEEFGDEAEYEFLDGGILKIVSPDGNIRVSYTPATVWIGLFADKDHPPGPRSNP